MFTSSGCDLQHMHGTLPTQEDVLHRDLISATDRMIEDTQRRMASNWVDPKFTEDQTPVHSFAPLPSLLPMDIRADVPPFPYKDDSEYHFADTLPPKLYTPQPEPPPKRRYGRFVGNYDP